MNKQIKGILLLTVATMIWGASFIGTKWTLQSYSPTWSNTLRFILCLPIILPYLLIKRSFFKGKKFLEAGVVLGFLLSSALWLQTIGISQTTVTKSGFLTTFYAFFTPLLSIYFFERKLSWRYWSLVLIALSGMALLCELRLDNFNRGDTFIMISSIVFSLHIIATEYYVREIKNPIELNFIQLFFMAVFSFLSAMTLEGLPNLGPLFQFHKMGIGSPIMGFIILSFFSSIIAFTIQVEAQKKITSHIASIVFLMESVFAAVFGNIFLQEFLTPIGLSGAVIILFSVAMVPFWVGSAKKKDTVQ